MTEYQKTYIELKKQFVATNEGPDNVRALYTFKEELEQSEDQQAKEVLVDVYDLLDFKKDAYELLCQIGNLCQIRVKRSRHRVFRRNLVHTVRYDCQRIRIARHIRQ